MNNMNWIIKTVFFALTLFTLTTSCDDEIDKHYDTNPSINSGASLMDIIEQKEELSTFASLLKQTGYDVLLRGTQAFTVWAPVNKALENVDLTDEKIVSNLVTNHVARFTHSASGSLDKSLYMLNTKRISFKRLGDTYVFGDVELDKSNMPASNGILHTIKEAVPFKNNIWEYLQSSGLDSVKKYLYGFNERAFLPEQSTAIDINNEGLTVYDSVFQVSNIMWNTNYGGKGIGALNHEDSLYTMILPSNEAWEKSYKKISPYFLIADKNNHPNPLLVDSLQRTNTQYAIVKDLVFRGLYNDPESLNANDSLVSTRASVFYDPSYLFRNSKQESTSNGLVYVTDELKYNSWESWHSKVLVEAETTQGRDDTDRNIKSINTPFNSSSTTISNKRYIEVIANSLSTTTSVTFSIPNTLAASYNIYAVFVPFRDNQRKTRIQYQISELRWRYSNGRWSQSSQSLKAGTPPQNVTDPTEMTKMLLVSDFKFPYANINEADPTIKIKIIAARASTTQDIQNKFTNDLSIDCILLEPVQQ